MGYFFLTITEQMFYNTLIATFPGVWSDEVGMDYKKRIIEMLEMLDERKLRLIFIHIKAILGLK